MNIPFVDLHSQYLSIKHEIDEAIQKVIAETAFVGGKYTNEFENTFAKACQAKYCIGVGNGTDAITIALKALDIKKGDEVITAANSFIATSEAITNAGAKVVFVDCDPKTYNIDIHKIEEKISGKTKAIIPVHLYGQPADMVSISEFAKKHNLYVIEDSAQAHLAEYYHGNQWTKVGTFGNIATFSFYPGKNLGAYGDAGALISNDEILAKKIKMIANHGRIAKYDHEFEGMNSRMDGLQGAILNVKLKHLPEWIKKRRSAAEIYNDLLSSVGEIITPFVKDNVKHVYHLYVIRTKERTALQEYLKSVGISSGIHYPIALPNLTAYKYLGHTPGDFPIASANQSEILSLPIFPEITIEQIRYVTDHIKKFYHKK